MNTAQHILWTHFPLTLDEVHEAIVAEGFRQGIDYEHFGDGLTEGYAFAGGSAIWQVVSNGDIFCN